MHFYYRVPGKAVFMCVSQVQPITKFGLRRLRVNDDDACFFYDR